MNQNQDSPLHLAVRSGNVNKVRVVLLNSKMSINSIDDYGRTPLELACELGNLDIIKTLIDHTVQDDKGTIGNNLLKIALDYEMDEVIFFIITKLKCIKGGYNISPLHERDEVMLVLICEFGYNPTNIKGRNGVSPLHVACKKGNLSLVKTLLIRDYHADLNAKDVFGNTPITLAIENERNEVMLVLIRQFPTSVKSKIGVSLHVACEKGNLSLVRTLIRDYHADINHKDSYGKTPLTLALENERDEVMLVLISEFGCDPTNIKGINGASPLHVACMKGNLSLVRTLICDYHADLHDKDNFGKTPFTLALVYERDEVMLVLISEFGCDPTNIKDSNLVSPLHVACKKGNPSLVRALIRDYHADLNDKDSLGGTPFSWALKNERDEVMLVLISEFGCDPTNIKDRYGVSPLHVACKKGNLSLVRTLICDYHADFNNRDYFGGTPFKWALENERDEVMLVLISEFGCNPTNIKDRNGVSPLHVACKKGNLSLVRTRDYHADLNDKDSLGGTPFSWALENERDEVMLVLISEFGYDPTNIKGEDGVSPLHVACKKGNLSLVMTLIRDYHADLNDEDSYGNTPLTLLLISEFGYNPTNIKDRNGVSPLHVACKKSNLILVRTLICDYHTDINGEDSYGKIPFTLVLENERDEVMLVLISEFGYDPTNIKGEDGVSPLHVACKKGNLNLVRTLIHDYHADLNDKDYFGKKSALDNERDLVMLVSEFGYDPSKIKRSLLLIACKKGNFSLLKTLVYDYHIDLNDKDCLNFKMALENERDEIALGLFDYGYDPKAKDEHGRSLLHIACEKGRLGVARALILHQHLELHDQDSDGNTPLVLAAENGREEVVLALINEFDCDPNNKDSKGRSLLHVALYGGWYGLFETLVNNFNFDLNGQDDCHETPLTLAIKHEREIRGISLESSSAKFIHSLLKELLLDGELQHDSPLGAIQPKQLVSSMLRQFNIDPNLKDFVHLACREGRIDVMHTLIQTFKVELNIRDDHNDTPLMTAVEYGRCEIVKSLISDYGCDISIKGSTGYSLLHIAIAEGHMEIFEMLVSEFGMSPIVIDGDGNTPLMLAMKKEKNELVLALLEKYSCDPNTKDNEGNSPLHVACMKGNLTLVKALMSHGADQNALDGCSNTPLMLAIKKNNFNEIMLALLTQNGCDPKIIDNTGNSPLHVACMKGNLDVVKALISHGADQNSLDSNNDTPITLAVKNGWDKLALTLIREYGCDPYTKDSHGRSLLHLALKKRMSNLFKKLINIYNFDLNARDNFNETPLMLAVKYESIMRRTSSSKNFHHLLLEEFLLHGKLMHDTPLGAIKPEELVSNMIRQFNVDPNLKYAEDDDTLFMKAVRYERWEIVKLLICDYGCDISIKGSNGYSFLHIAIVEGHMEMFEMLVSEFGMSPKVIDGDGNTPLMLAMKKEKNELVLALLDKHGCDPNTKDNEGNSPLHIACMKGNLTLVKALMSHGADQNALDGYSNTPLMLTIKNKFNEIMLALLSESGCDPNTEDNDGNSPLHVAYIKGNPRVVRTLISHGADLNSLDSNNDTPITLAVKNGWDKLALTLIREYGCDPYTKDSHGRSLLHLALKKRRSNLFKKLINAYNFDLNARDNFNETPLMLAVKYESSIRKIPLSKDFLHHLLKEVLMHGKLSNDTPLGAIKPKHLVSNLISGFNLDSDTLFLKAVKYENCEIMKLLICDHGCDPNINGHFPLHVACIKGNLRLVRTLITHGADLNVLDEHGYTPVMIAVISGNGELVKLLHDHGCDINVTASNGWSLLHIAISKGHIEMLEMLVSKFGMSPLVVDEAGYTPLHVCAELGHYDCVRSLLEDFQSPIYIRNRAGKTPIDVARSNVKPLFDDYLSYSNQAIQADYQSMQRLAEKKFSGAHHITKLFVVGHPGAGKSSLVEALKREGFFISFFRVSEKSVPPHTAGIVPSIHTSPSYGRVQFYDFAGDPEYYSSHAAILEKIFQSKIGTTICIIVLDLQENNEEIEKKFIYWSTFISNSCKNPQNLPSFLVIGSHSDLLSNQREVRRKNDFIQSMIFIYDNESVYFSLDCCYPRSDNLHALRKHIKTISEKSKPYSLSQEMSVLLGLLEKDFQSVTACTAHVLVDHINQVGLCLPRSMTHLHPLLLQLQDIGEVLIVGGEEDDSYLILSISQLTNEVHKKLFAVDAFPNKSKNCKFSIGLLPESFLQKVLPEYITKECLIQLQYCQEVSPVEIDPDLSILPNLNTSADAATSPDQSLLFFPALCTVDKSAINWHIPPTSYSIGWLARCSRPQDYFPPRFLHVVLLRIALKFTVLAPSPPVHHALDIKPQCKMWKTGVHWLMEEGVECTMQLVDVSKSVVVALRGQGQNYEKYGEIMCKIISCVMEAKAEFCPSITPDFFLLDSTDTIECFSDGELFSMRSIEKVLMSPEGKEVCLNVSGDKTMSCKKLMFMRKLIYWYSLFPIEFFPVFQLLDEISAKWHDLGLYLCLPKNILDVIQEENSSVQKCLKEMVSAWMNSSLDPPCWWHLAKALRDMEMGRLADEIERNHGQLIKCSLTPLTLYIIRPQVTTLKCRRSSLIQSAMLRSQRKSSWSRLLVWWGPSGRPWPPFCP